MELNKRMKGTSKILYQQHSLIKKKKKSQQERQGRKNLDAHNHQ